MVIRDMFEGFEGLDRKQCIREFRATNRKKLSELKTKRMRETIDIERRAFAYARTHPELCWPVGKKMYYRNRYGVKLICTVDIVMNGLPGTIDTLAPMEEQPAHLRSPELLTAHVNQHRLNFVCWPDAEYVNYIINIVKGQNETRSQNPSNLKK
jgi:hypothetical protein